MVLAGRRRTNAFSSLWAPVCGARYSSRLQQQGSVGGQALLIGTKRSVFKLPRCTWVAQRLPNPTRTTMTLGLGLLLRLAFGLRTPAGNPEHLQFGKSQRIDLAGRGLLFQEASAQQRQLSCREIPYWRIRLRSTPMVTSWRVRSGVTP